MVGIVLLIVFLSIAVIVGSIFLGLKFYNKKREESQHYLSDKELLLLIDAEPDAMITKKQLARQTELTQSEASNRMSYLMMQGILRASYDSKFQYYYSLKEKIDHRDPPQLSAKPFLTVEDIILLFKHFDFNLSIQKICIASGLPVSVIKKEMKYFEKEKVIKTLYNTATDGFSTRTFYILQEPYRSNPDGYLDSEERMDLDLERLYEKEISKERRK